MFSSLCQETCMLLVQASLQSSGGLLYLIPHSLLQPSLKFIRIKRMRPFHLFPGFTYSSANACGFLELQVCVRAFQSPLSKSHSQYSFLSFLASLGFFVCLFLVFWGGLNWFSCLRELGCQFVCW